MRSLNILFLLFFALMCFGCGDDDTEKPQEAPIIQTLLTQLEYPKGLWIGGGKVYFTEASGRAGHGGRDALSEYDIAAKTKAILKDPLVCTEGVVVTGDGGVYLTSWIGTKPGDAGRVSYFNAALGTEEEIAVLNIAAVDMLIETTGDIYVIGSSETPAAPSLYMLPAGEYGSPRVVHEALGKTLSLAKIGDVLYYSEDGGSINRFVGSVFEAFVDRDAESMSVSSTYLYYADLAGGTIGRIAISTKADETLAKNLHSPSAVRWDAASAKLYFLEAGTAAAQYKDGTLKVITGIHE